METDRITTQMEYDPEQEILNAIKQGINTQVFSFPDGKEVNCCFGFVEAGNEIYPFIKSYADAQIDIVTRLAIMGAGDPVIFSIIKRIYDTMTYLANCPTVPEDGNK